MISNSEQVCKAEVSSSSLFLFLFSDGSSAAAISFRTLEAFSAAALFSVSFAISALACSMILFASAIVCSGLSVVDSSVDKLDRDDAEVGVGVVANVDRVDSVDSGGIVVVNRVDCMDKVAGLVANVGGKVVTAKLVEASHSS